MAAPVSHKVLASAFQITISSVLTTIPGLENIECDFGENLSYENSDITSDYQHPTPSGVRGEGSGSADIINDPLGTVQQFVQKAYNEKTEHVGAIIIGATGVTLPCKFFVTKMPLSGKKAEGFKGKLEWKFSDPVEWNEADPV